MRAIFFKEMREHACWIPLGLIAIGLACWLSVPSEQSSIYASESLDYIIAFAVGVACGAYAIFLGVVQAIVDERAANRGYSMHRAVSEPDILRGKLLAGAVLYIAALLPPGLLTFMYFATRDVVLTPMHPGQLLIAGITSLACFVLYPTSMLVIRREANWFGTKLLPFGFAASALFLFGQGVSAGGAWQLLGIALCFAFFIAISVATYRKSVLRSGILLFSSLVMVFAIQLLVGELLTSFSPSRTRVSSSLQFEMDGSGQLWAVRVEHAYDKDRKRYLAGSKLTPELDWSALGVLPGGFGASSFDYPKLSCREDKTLRFYKTSAQSGNGRQLLHPDGHWLVYSNNYEQPLVGTVTQAGLHRGPTPSGEPFSLDAQSREFVVSKTCLGGTLIGSSDGLLLYDENNGTANTLFDGPVDCVWALGDWEDAPVDVLVSSNDGLHRLKFIDGDSTPDAPTQRLDRSAQHVEAIAVARLPKLPEPFDGFVSLANAGGSYAVMALNKYAIFSSDAGVWEVHALPTQSSPNQRTSTLVIGACTPPVYLAGLSAYAFSQDDLHMLRLALRDLYVDIGLVVLATLLASIVAVIYLCNRRGLNRRQMVGWCAATCCLGLAAPLAVLAIYPRIYRETCEHCGDRRRVDLLKCDLCGAEPAELSTEGIGIFDAGTSQSSAQPALSLQSH